MCDDEVVPHLGEDPPILETGWVQALQVTHKCDNLGLIQSCPMFDRTPSLLASSEA